MSFSTYISNSPLSRLTITLQLLASPRSRSTKCKNSASIIEPSSERSTFFSLAISEKTSISSLLTKIPPKRIKF